MIKIFEAKFPSLPFGVTVYAESMAEAASMVLQWHRGSAQYDSQSLDIFEKDVLSEEMSELDDLRLLKQSGIAVWKPRAGWIVVPVDLTQEGLLHREIRRVTCFTVKRTVTDEPLLVCAPGHREALDLYVGYSEARSLSFEGLMHAAEVHPDDIALHWPSLLSLMGAGAVGVPGIVRGELQILLPWDEAAGQI